MGIGHLEKERGVDDRGRGVGVGGSVLKQVIMTHALLMLEKSYKSMVLA